ncbi:hypothetical protein FACS1894125_4110 [Actinomycetota bacterium]|nr:hypothetical protein FACS1894125_4110 [Actinomycetota bacterium]
MKFDVSKYLVIGPENVPEGVDFVTVVRDALLGGITFLQLRAKDIEDVEMFNYAKQIADLIAELELSEVVTFVLDDAVDVTFWCRSEGIKIDGVHIGQVDIPPHIVRQILGDDVIVGLSTNDERTVLAANALADGLIDYIGIGPVNPTNTKKTTALLVDRMKPKGLDKINELAKLSRYPVVVGGGVKAEHIMDLANSSVDGFFVVSAIAAAKNPRKATEELVELWDAGRSHIATSKNLKDVKVVECAG